MLSILSCFLRRTRAGKVLTACHSVLTYRYVGSCFKTGRYDTAFVTEPPCRKIPVCHGRERTKRWGRGSCCGDHVSCSSLISAISRAKILICWLNKFLDGTVPFQQLFTELSGPEDDRSSYGQSLTAELIRQGAPIRQLLLLTLVK